MAQKPSKSRFPSTPLEASSLVRVSKTVGISRRAIEDDVEYLLYHFISHPTQTFHDFDRLWHELHFNHVHFACVKREFRANYMNAFYKSFLDYFPSTITPMKSGVLFSLYFMYISQPAIWGKNRIRVTRDLYHNLFEFYVESIDTDTNVEAALIFDKLRESEAFLFVEEQDPDGCFTEEKIEFRKAIEMNQRLEDFKKTKMNSDPIKLCSNDLLNEYKQLALEYQQAKRETFYTPQATSAMKQTLKETANIVETRPRLLRNFLLNSTLGQDETDIVQQVKRTGQQLLNSKRRKIAKEATLAHLQMDMMNRHAP
ncbi:H/ACA snoRNP pseudouridylase subunit [Mucor velutinosus]|uniref:H/ACA snoRNP pseudouridylase subunit n=1 Tax=Mucor velutinosus TaxID=708070 RepID=A0AAN7I2J0_9FUNG|nr:H/ACA snoRNP pseudouridylase subunit [Mucor velutinosus]